MNKTVIFLYTFRDILQNIYVLSHFLVIFSVLPENCSSICYVCWHAASSDGVARLWNVETGAVEREYNGHQKAVTSLAFRDEIIRDWSYVCVCVCGWACVTWYELQDPVCFCNVCGWIRRYCFKMVKYCLNLCSSLIFPRNHPYFQSPWSTQPDVSVCTITSIANPTKLKKKHPSGYSWTYMLFVMWSEWWHPIYFYNTYPLNVEYKAISKSFWTP